MINVILSSHVAVLHATEFLMASDANISKTCTEKYHQYTGQEHEICAHWQNFVWGENRAIATLSERKLFWKNIANRLNIPADGQLVILFDAEHCKWNSILLGISYTWPVTNL